MVSLTAAIRFVSSLSMLASILLKFARLRPRRFPEGLHEATGWPLRRFNPAFAYMLSQIDDRRVLKGGTDEYAAGGFFLVDSDRVDLHRFAARLRR